MFAVHEADCLSFIHLRTFCFEHTRYIIINGDESAVLQRERLGIFRQTRDSHHCTTHCRIHVLVLYRPDSRAVLMR